MELEKVLSEHLIPADQIFGSLAEGVCIAGRDFSFIYWNTAAQTILFNRPDDVPPEEWAKHYGLYYLDSDKFLSFEDLPMVMALRGESYDDYRILAKGPLNPEGYVLSVSGRPIRNGNATVGGITSFRNITVQVKLEKQLRAERSFYERVLDLMPGIVFIKDLSGKFIYGNRGFHEILGTSEINGKMTENYLNIEQTKEIRSHDQLVLSTLSPQSFEEVIKWSNETRSIFQTIRFPFYGPDHELSGVCAVGRDITREVDAQHAIERERHQAAKLAKLATLGMLAGEIAHEIRNPLTAISGTAALINAIAKEEHPDQSEILKHVQLINKTIDRISDIVSSLTMFSRDADRMKAHDFSVRDLMENVRTALNIRRGFRRIPLTIEYPLGDPGIFHGNMVQVSQVVLNLAVNAFEAVEGSAGPWVKIVSWSRPAELVFEVSDSGPGIPAELREKIFEPYFTTKAGEGTGLGLSICRKITRQYGGEIEYHDDGKVKFFRAVFRRDLSEKSPEVEARRPH